MALFHECMPQCAQKELDTADIVRDAMFRQLQTFPLGRERPTGQAWTPQILSIRARALCSRIAAGVPCARHETGTLGLARGLLSGH